MRKLLLAITVWTIAALANAQATFKDEGVLGTFGSLCSQATSYSTPSYVWKLNLSKTSVLESYELKPALALSFTTYTLSRLGGIPKLTFSNPPQIDPFVPTDASQLVASTRAEPDEVTLTFYGNGAVYTVPSLVFVRGISNSVMVSATSTHYQFDEWAYFGVSTDHPSGLEDQFRNSSEPIQLMLSGPGAMHIFTITTEMLEAFQRGFFTECFQAQ